MLIAQEAITGIVTSQQDETLAYANVLLLSAQDSSLIKGAISSDKGDFSINEVHSGDYIVAVSMIGFETSYTLIEGYEGLQSYPLGMVILQRLENQLSAVDVRAERMLYEQHIDRLVVNVEKNIVSSGSNALEVLARIPGVGISELNNSISINGNQGVLVMIDGKINRLPLSALFDLLRTMNAETIQKVELFETPPAEYEAEGKGGLIKIISKRNPELGTNGSYSVNTGYGRRLKYGASFNVNHRMKRANIYGNYSLRNSFSESIFSFERNVNQAGKSIYTDTRNERRSELFSHNIRIGTDIEISDKTVIGGFATGFISNSFTESNNRSVFEEDQNLTSTINNLNEEERRLENAMFNLYAHHTFHSGAAIEFDVDYLTYQNNNPSTYQNTFLNETDAISEQTDMTMNRLAPIQNLSLKLDFNKALGEDVEWKAGAKAFRSQFDNDIIVNDIINGSPIKNERFSQDYSLQENIAAAYSSLSFKVGKNTKFITGLRYEFTDYLLRTQTDPEFLDLEFSNLFPSLFISQKLGDSQNLNLSYSRRITRPAFNELAPFVTFIDPTTFFSGNPSLVPGISDNVSLNYQIKKVTLNGSFSHTKDAIFKYQPVVDAASNTQIYTTINIDQAQNAGLRLTVPVKINNWWSTRNTTSWGWNRLVINNESQNSVQDIYAYSLSSVQSFNFKNNWSAQLTGIYQSAAFYGLLRVAPKGALNLGVRKVLPNGWGTLSLNASDILRTNIWRSTTVVPELNLDNSSIFDVETRVVTVTYSTTFGSAKIKKVRKRTTSSADQSRRF